MRKLEKAFTSMLFGVLRVFIRVRKVGAVPRASVRRILVIRQHNQLGDMLCAVPLLRALRATYPGAHLALLARPLNCEVLRGADFLDEVIVYDKREFLRSPFAVWRFSRALKKRNFDLVLSPSTVSMSVTTDVLAFLSRAKRRVGPGSLHGRKNVTDFLYNVRVDLDWSRDPTAHQTQRNIDLASILVLEDVSRELTLGLSDEDIARGREHLDARRGTHPLVIGFHPGAAKPANRWDALRFAEIANRCAEIYGAYIVISSGPDDDEAVREMTLNMPNEYMLLTTQIRHVASVIRHCDAFVTNDTGIMHLAAAAGAPTLSLFGPTDPLQWAPIGRQHRFILGQGGTVDSIPVEKVWNVLTAMLHDRAAKL
ncbi:MAG: glycosyltransferase family 9 protein [Ignavibacteria bacterium]|nr:glycosyltransferase family 9 protein [Ignavibacteria bacterium]